MRISLFLAPALLLLASVAPAQAPAIQTISLYSYGFKPGPITLQAGHPVTLRFVNSSTKGHDFTAPEFFRASRILAGSVAKGGVKLSGGESKSVTLVPAAGQYRAHCSRPFHTTFGMKTAIIVR
ncbi:MAG: copper-binding protein [Sphingomonas sp.]|nr:copper-binding protein [Sphingomonas sp.]